MNNEIEQRPDGEEGVPGTADMAVVSENQTDPLEELDALSNKPSPKKLIFLIAGLMLVGLLLTAGVLLLLRKPDKAPGEQAAAQQENITSEDGAEPYPDDAVDDNTDAIIEVAATPTPLPSPTPFPSPTPTPLPVGVSIIYPQIIPIGRPQPVRWIVSDPGEEVSVKIVDFGGAMLMADPATNDVIVKKTVTPGQQWEIVGLLDPQAGQGTVVLEIVTSDGVTEPVNLSWETSDVVMPVTGQTIINIDGIEDTPKPDSVVQAKETSNYDLGNVTVDLGEIPDTWQIQPTDKSIIIYFSSDAAENNSAIITPFLSGDIDTSDPTAVVNYLLDTNNSGGGGVTSYGDLVLESEGETVNTPYPSNYIRVKTADDTLYGFLGAVSLDGQAVIVQGFSPSAQEIDELASWFKYDLTFTQ